MPLYQKKQLHSISPQKIDAQSTMGIKYHFQFPTSYVTCQWHISYRSIGKEAVPLFSLSATIIDFVHYAIKKDKQSLHACKAHIFILLFFSSSLYLCMFLWIYCWKSQFFYQQCSPMIKSSWVKKLKMV